MSGIVLSSAVRQNLLSLQSTADLLQSLDNRANKVLTTLNTACAAGQQS